MGSDKERKKWDERKTERDKWGGIKKETSGVR